VCEAPAVSGEALRVGAAAALIRTDVPKGGGDGSVVRHPDSAVWRRARRTRLRGSLWPEEERSHVVRPQCRRVIAGASGTNYKRVSGDVSEVFSVHITAEGIVQKTRDPDQGQPEEGLASDELNQRGSELCVVSSCHRSRGHREHLLEEELPLVSIQRSHCVRVSTTFMLHTCLHPRGSI